MTRCCCSVIGGAIAGLIAAAAFCYGLLMFGPDMPDLIDI